MNGLKAVTPPGALLKAGWDWLQSRRKAVSRPGRLRVAELVSLGDKRLVAVVELDGRQFLIGCGPASVTMLAQLEPRTAERSAAYLTDTREELGGEFSQVFREAFDGNGVSA